MKLIAHRGNLSGPDREKENTTDTIRKALEEGFDVELDVRLVDGNWFLGHDSPDYLFNPDLLKDQRIWTHCKNYNALSALVTEPAVNCFWHQEDDFTLTSMGYIWAYPGKLCRGSNSMSICVMPEWDDMKIPENIYGICSDFVRNLSLDS